MRMILPTLTMLAFLATGCAPSPKEVARAAVEADRTRGKLDAALAGLVPGTPVQCINRFQSQRLEAYGPTLLYRISGSLVYRSDTAGGCEHAGADDILVTRTTTGQLCRGDIGQTFDRAGRTPTGGCSFGEFVPYRKP